MASNPTVDPERIKEKEHLIQDGVDISGHWNRMFEQRVIWDYTPELIDKVTDLDGESPWDGATSAPRALRYVPSILSVTTARAAS